jgi:hypothetical protein
MELVTEGVALRYASAPVTNERARQIEYNKDTWPNATHFMLDLMTINLMKAAIYHKVLFEGKLRLFPAQLGPAVKQGPNHLGMLVDLVSSSSISVSSSQTGYSSFWISCSDLA